MAATTTSNLPNILARVYSRDSHFYEFEQALTPFLTLVVSPASNEEPLGAGRYFQLWLGDAHASGGTAEGGDLPSAGQPNIVQGVVAQSTQTAAFGVSEQMLSVGLKDGTIGPDALHQHVEMTTRNLLFEINRLVVAGHGTGRMGVVEAATVASTTFVARNPEHVLQFRVGQKIAFYDTDTGGSIQGTTRTVTAINFETRTITMDAVHTLTAGWSVYRAISSSVTAYGVAPNGMRGIADNGTLTSTIFGVTRSATPDVNASVLTAGGGTQPYSEKLLRKAINRAFFTAGQDEPDLILTNRGIVSEHFNHLTPDRIYDGTSGVPSYEIGYKKYPVFNNNGKAIPFFTDGVFPARELIVLKKSYLRKHIAREASWLGDNSGPDGSASVQLLQAPGSSGSNYALTKIGGQAWMGNISYRMPKGLVRLTEIADEELCGDTVDA